MKNAYRAAGAFVVALVCAIQLTPQNQALEKAPGAPPKLIVLAYQEIEPRRAGEREKLEVGLARWCDRFNASNYWTDWEALSGPRESFSLNLFGSFDEPEQVTSDWNRLLATHSEVAHTQEQIQNVISNERRIFAMRRDDLGYLGENIDLSKARFLRVDEIHLLPGHENDFADAMRIRKEAYANQQADSPWIVYEVSAGMPAPTFLVLMPMSVLKQNDDLLAWEEKLPETAGDRDADQLVQVAREGYTSTESHLYAVSPEMSHVSKEFARSDAGFWKRGQGTATAPDGKSSPAH